MKIRKLIIVLSLFFLPIFIRIIWFYQGIFTRKEKILNPGYESILIPQPTLSTPVPYETIPGREKSVVLFDQAHANKFTMTEIDSLKSSLSQLGSEISIHRSQDELSESLKKSDAYVVIAPTREYNEEEIEAVEEFVYRGGRLLIIADPTRSTTENETDREKSVILANEILQPFNLAFRNDYIYNLTHNEGNFRNIFIYPSADVSIVENIDELVFYAAHSLSDSSNKVLVSDEHTMSSLDDVAEMVSVSALDFTGNVLAIGDLTFMTSPYNQVVDNNLFIKNIAKFLSDGYRTKLLADFPFVFKTHIGVILTDGITLDGDLLDILNQLKNKFSINDIDVSILEEPNDQFDLLILGRYPPEAALADWVDPFGIKFYGSGIDRDQVTGEGVASTPEKTSINGFTHYVPGFGNLPADEVGFILLDQINNQQRLFLISDNQMNVYSLLKRVISGSLDHCLANERVAVCSQENGYGPNAVSSTPTAISTVPLPNDSTPTLEPTFTATPSPLP